ncbi:MAG: hypothetical protein Fur0044_23330 [Anaerolineae bacterium]|nr:hypothetical protein [Anaerolineales bacterium]MCQ3980453.1 hypothetical protein [Anaerolineae bacterium]
MFSLPTLLLILAGVSIGAAVIAALIAFRSAREARSAIFPIVREEETLRAQRARIATFMLSALTALFLGGWLATLRLGASPVDDNVAAVPPVESPAIAFVTETAIIVTAPPIVEATPTVAQQVQAVATVTPLPPATVPPVSTTETAVEAAVGPATAAQPALAEPPLPPPTATLLPPTAVPTDTPTPTPTVNIAQIPTSGPRTPAPPGVRMGPIQFAANITPNIEAINPSDFFPQSTESVYAVYPYSGMVNGVNFAAVWYQNGVELWRDEQKWRWGDNAQFYSFLNPPGDGLYKLELYVNDSVVATGIFEIR